jgi:hypothetical protein
MQNFANLSLLLFFPRGFYAGAFYGAVTCQTNSVSTRIHRAFHFTCSIFCVPSNTCRLYFYLSRTHAFTRRRGDARFPLRTEAVNSLEFRPTRAISPNRFRRSRFAEGASCRTTPELRGCRRRRIPRRENALDRRVIARAARSTMKVSAREFSLARQASEQPPIAATFTPCSAILI